MVTPGEFLLGIIVVGIIFIIIFSRIFPSKKSLRKRAYDLEQQGRFIDALDLYIRDSLGQAAQMVLRTPEASQILVLRRLENKYSRQQLEKVFIQLARESMSRKDPHTAANAFILAKKPFAAAKVYIDFGGIEFVPAAIQRLDKNPSLIHDRDQAIRNLARHAYNTQKFMEAAELLYTIGADEEANTVLIAAATEMRKRGRNQEAEMFLTSAGQPSIAIKHYLREVKENLREGNIEKMRRSLSVAKNLVENISPAEKKSIKGELDPLSNKIIEYDRLLKILDSARDILRKKSLNQAIALYDELLESLGNDTPAPIFAEAALANKEENPQYAAELFQSAARLAKTARASESFKSRARELKLSSPGRYHVSEQTVSNSFQTGVNEFCSVCRKQITDPISLVRCPECGTPAHFPHLAEWLKMRRNCPICKNKIRITKPKDF
ncbi:MAG: hypothetical protein ACXAC8_00765 [Candidatus Hodarchaeales archaeon]|jgi:hypothetical protein